jgi:hypothetical protein
MAEMAGFIGVWSGNFGGVYWYTALKLGNYGAFHAGSSRAPLTLGDKNLIVTPVSDLLHLYFSHLSCRCGTRLGR